MDVTEVPLPTTSPVVRSKANRSNRLKEDWNRFVSLCNPVDGYNCVKYERANRMNHVFATSKSKLKGHKDIRMKRSQPPGTFVMTATGITSRTSNLTAIAGKPFTLSCPFSSYTPVAEVYFLRGKFLGQGLLYFLSFSLPASVCAQETVKSSV